MPTYSYACTACEHRFDTVQTFTDPALTDCPECAGRLRKLFAPVGVVFKGSGFYRTDSRADQSNKPGATDKHAPESGSGTAAKEGSGGSTEPAKSDSAKSDSAKSDSAKSDSGKSRPGKSDSAQSRSAQSGAASSSARSSSTSAASS